MVLSLSSICRCVIFFWLASPLWWNVVNSRSTIISWDLVSGQTCRRRSYNSLCQCRLVLKFLSVGTFSAIKITTFTMCKGNPPIRCHFFLISIYWQQKKPAGNKNLFLGLWIYVVVGFNCIGSFGLIRALNNTSVRVPRKAKILLRLAKIFFFCKNAFKWANAQFSNQSGTIFRMTLKFP